MYHERQQLQRCLLHTLNNMLQQQAWTVQSLNDLSDSIQAQRTRWLGSYDANVLAAALQQHGWEVTWHDARDTQLSTLNLGDSSCSTDPQQQQDSLQQQQQHQQARCSAVDRPTHSSTSHEHHLQQQEQELRQQQEQQQQQELVGLILNVAGSGWLSRLLGGRHWIAIRRLQGAWWNLDSQLQQPVSFASGPAAGGTAGDSGAAALKDFLQQALHEGAHLLLVTRPCGQPDHC